jgi:hypothetical protein
LELAPHEIVAPARGSQRAIRRLERPTPPSDERIEIDMIVCHATSLPAHVTCRRRGDRLGMSKTNTD